MEPSWTSDLEFFFTQRPFLTSVVFLTLHDTLLTTRGRRGFIVLIFLCFLGDVFNAVDTFFCAVLRMSTW